MLAVNLIKAALTRICPGFYTSYLVYCYSLSLLEHIHAVRICTEGPFLIKNR